MLAPPPKLIAALLEGGQLKISSGLPHAPIWLAELQAFRASIGESGNAKFEAVEGMHDDLVLAARPHAKR